MRNLKDTLHKQTNTPMPSLYISKRPNHQYYNNTITYITKQQIFISWDYCLQNSCFEKPHLHENVQNDPIGKHATIYGEFYKKLQLPWE